MKNSLCALIIFVLTTISTAINASEPMCSEDALAQAQKLLTFHHPIKDDRIYIVPNVRELPSIPNPANEKQEFQVLEVDGQIYKGQYRMRFLYYHLENTCLLMGQEILTLANI